MAPKKENEQLRTATKKAEMIKALIDCLGVVTAAADRVGINRETHRRWMQTDVEYASQVSDINERRVDFLESKALERVNDGSDTMIIFLLKTQGKERGYVERQELRVTNEGELTPEEKQELEALRREADESGLAT